MKKNDVLTIRIEDMGVDGEGIGKVDDIPLFVKDALIGDVVSVLPIIPDRLICGVSKVSFSVS